MTRIVLDTDAASAVYRERDDPRLRRHLPGASLGIAFVTMGELNKWMLLRQWGPDLSEDFQNFLETLVVVPYQREIAETWGGFRPMRNAADGLAPSTTAGSRPAASDTAFHCSRSTPRTSPTSPSTTACNY